MKIKLRIAFLLIFLCSYQITLSQSFKDFEVYTKDTLYINGESSPKLDWVINTSSDSVHIIIEEGVYYIDQDLWIKGTHKIIEGRGKVDINCTDFESNVMWVMSASNIKLKNLRLKHFKPDNTGGYCTGHVIFVQESKNLIIEDCDINGCGVIGIKSSAANKNFLIKNCAIHNNSIAAYSDVKGKKWINEVLSDEVCTFIDNKVYNNGHGKIIDLSEDFMENSTVIIFPSFTLEVEDYCFENIILEDLDGGEQGYTIGENEDAIELEYFHYMYENPYGYSVRNDTLYLEETLECGIWDMSFSLFPSVDDVEFQILYKYDLRIDEVIDYRVTTVKEDYPFEHYQQFTPWFKLTDSASVYKFPQWVGHDKWGVMTHMYEMKDTSFVIPGEWGTEVRYHKDGKLYTFWANKLIIRIDRLENGHIRESRYIVIEQNYGC